MFGNFLNTLPLWVQTAIALFDFMIKASVAYMETEQGRKEWDDVTSVYEDAANNPEGSAVSVQSQSVQDAASDNSVAQRPQSPRVVRG